MHEMEDKSLSSPFFPKNVGMNRLNRPGSDETERRSQLPHSNSNSPKTVNLDLIHRHSFASAECDAGHEVDVPQTVFSLANDAPAPRLLDRQAPFHQSSGRLKISRVVHDGQTIKKLRMQDPFHSLVNMKTSKLVTIAVSVVVFSWIVIAILFRLVSRQCGLRATSFLRSLYLAIETVETIGYGVDDSYFNGCISGIFVLGLSALWETLLSALIISVVYTRISRAQSRACSICFSEKAIISQIDGNWYFIFQICDFRKHQLCEAHMRLYCIQHTQSFGGVRFQTRAMRVQHPDDELGGMLLLALPQLVIHRIDPWSPLCPIANRYCMGCTPANSFQFPEIPQRAADGENGNRDPGAVKPPTPNLSNIVRHLQQGKFEILCLLEGVDPISSGTLQARHSYAYDQIVFNASFNKCVSHGADGTCEINFDHFHEIVHMDDSTGAVQSMP